MIGNMQSELYSALSKTAVRNAHADWMDDERFTTTITLTFERHEPISFERLNRSFGSFCYEIDRYGLGIAHPRFRCSHDRFYMIAMPEKLDTNPHLHGVADFSESFMGDRVNQNWQGAVNNIWRRITDGSGHVHFTDEFDRGMLHYITKEMMRPDHQCLLSWDYHRDDKLARRPSATCLQHGASSRKAVSQN
jgi:hypothetical protein